MAERMAQWSGTEPLAVAADWDRIREAAAVWGKPLETRGDIHALLGSIDGDPSHNIEATRWEYYQRPFKVRRFSIYCEKWQTLLEGLNPDYVRHFPSAELVQQLCTMFSAQQGPFEKLRHTNRCDGRPRCHHRCGCRHNFYNYDLTIRAYLLLLAQAGTFSEARRHLSTFDGKLKRGKVKVFARRMRELVAESGWDWVKPEWVLT